MRRYTMAPVAALAGALAVGSPAPAEAGGVSFGLGAGFAVGGVSFHIAYAPPHAGYAPYYYRTVAPLRYSGYRCSSHCFKGGGYWYHAPSCGLVGHHFSRYGHHPQSYHGLSYYGRGHYPVGPAPGYYLRRHSSPYYGHGSPRHHSYGHHGYGRQWRGHGPGGYGFGRPGRGHGGHHGRGGHWRGPSKHGHGRGHAAGSARKTRPPRH